MQKSCKNEIFHFPLCIPASRWVLEISHIYNLSPDHSDQFPRKISPFWTVCHSIMLSSLSPAKPTLLRLQTQNLQEFPKYKLATLSTSQYHHMCNKSHGAAHSTDAQVNSLFKIFTLVLLIIITLLAFLLRSPPPFFSKGTWLSCRGKGSNPSPPDNQRDRLSR